MNKILYLSLTGMTEPLGRSQVLEYLIDLSKKNKIFLITFEREDTKQEIDRVNNIMVEHGIKWKYFIYSNRFGVLSTLSQIMKTTFLSISLIRKHKIKLIHARSFIPAVIGIIIKLFYKVNLLYDIRGFSIDEKVDRGRLHKQSLLYKILKIVDKYIYTHADHIVTLTHKSKDILIKLYNIYSDAITVIQTCANKDIFKIVTKNENQQFKKSLGFNDSDIIFIHTGTVSGWYDFEKELLVMSHLMKRNNKIKFIILNKNEQGLIRKQLKKINIDESKVLLTHSDFEMVHKYLNVSNFSIFFIKASFSKQASAPTKFAENVACLLPSITNKNVGDMEYYINKYNVGLLFDLDKFNIKEVVDNILVNLDKDYSKESFKQLFNDYFDKIMAVEKYEKVYKELK